MEDTSTNGVESGAGVNHNKQQRTSPPSSFAAAGGVIPNHYVTPPTPGGNNGINGNLKRTESLSGNPGEDNILLHSFDYIRSLPGKQVRSKLSVAFNYWLKVEAEKVDKVCDIVELLHNA
jgi:hypothetical protein